MRKRIWIPLLVVLTVLLVVVLFRWPRIEKDNVLIIQSWPSEDTVELQYRMRQPFQVAVSHWLKMEDDPMPKTGIRVGGGGKVLRKERVVLQQSRHDLLRGEHVVTLQLVKGDELRMEANGEHVSIPLWSTKSGRKTEFLHVTPLGTRVFFGNGIGNSIVQMGAGDEQEELLVVYAGTDVEEWSR